MVVMLERVITLAKPHQAASICSKKLAATFMIILLICISLCYIPVLLYFVNDFDIVQDENNKYIIESFCTSVDAYSDWIDMFLHMCIPFLLTLAGNIIIIVLLYFLYV